MYDEYNIINLNTNFHRLEKLKIALLEQVFLPRFTIVLSHHNISNAHLVRKKKIVVDVLHELHCTFNVQFIPPIGTAGYNRSCSTRNLYTI